MHATELPVPYMQLISRILLDVGNNSPKHGGLWSQLQPAESQAVNLSLFLVHVRPEAYGLLHVSTSAMCENFTYLQESTLW